MKHRILAVIAAALMFMAMVAGPAAAQPVVQGGLVNVTIQNIEVETGDILSQNTVQVGVNAALALAANVCDVNVNVIARQLRHGGTTCESAVEGGQFQRVILSQ